MDLVQAFIDVATNKTYATGVMLPLTFVGATIWSIASGTRAAVQSNNQSNASMAKAIRGQCGARLFLSWAGFGAVATALTM